MTSAAQKGATDHLTGAQSRRKGPRPKHVPQRMCVVCRERSTKRALTRVVRTTEGDVIVDPTGRINGRGAYICSKASCWERAVSSNVLAGALKTELTNEARELLRAASQDHIAPEDHEERERTIAV